MSIKIMSKVWDSYQDSPTRKLAMLALADWCDDEGGRLFPSIKTLAKKVGLSEAQARRIIHSFIEDGYLAVVGNEQGGASSRIYRLDISKFDTPCASATPCTGDSPTPCTHATPPLAPMQPEPLSKPSKRTISIICPQDFQIEDAHFKIAQERGLDIYAELEKMRDWSLSGNNKKADWDATFRNWLRNAKVQPKNWRDDLKHTADLLTGRADNVAAFLD